MELCWNKVPKPEEVIIQLDHAEKEQLGDGMLPSKLNKKFLHSYLNKRPGFFLLKTGITDEQEAMQRLVYEKICTTIGNLNTRYGAFYDVKDYGGDYRESRIPVSQTHETTGFHTDSSAVGYYPKAVGLLCVRPALEGGESLLVNAANAYTHLIRNFPVYEKLLGFSAILDIVTPGTEFSLENLRKNCFPILEKSDTTFTFRYMRYWLERGHQKAGEPLPDGYVEMLNALDHYLDQPKNQLSILMQAGDILIFNNTFLLHNRTAFTNSAEKVHERIMVRAWMDY